MLNIYEFSWVDDLTFGLNSVEMLPEKIRKLIGPEGNVVIITDIGIEKAGILDKVKDKIAVGDYDIQTWSKLESEPTADDYNKAIDFARSINPDLIVGLGGGSAMDVASSTSALVKNPGRIEDYFGPPFNQFEKKGTYLITIPTTAGSGAEVTPYDVVVKDGMKRDIMDKKLYADVALVDPMLTLKLPRGVTVSSGLDVLAGSIESVLSTASNPITEALAFDAIKRCTKYLPRVYADGQDLEARYHMSWAALESGIIVTQTGTPLGHAFSYAFPSPHAAHGKECGFCIPYSILYSVPAAMDKIVGIARAMKIPIDGVGRREIAIRTARTAKNLVEDFGCYTSLREGGVQEDEIPDMVDRLLSVYSYVTENSPRMIDKESAQVLFRKMWKGEIE